MVHARTVVASQVTTACWKPSAIRTTPNVRNCRNGLATMTSTEDSHPCSAAG
jgi:hypothetical protein